jgi:hypothetical protein
MQREPLTDEQRELDWPTLCPGGLGGIVADANDCEVILDTWGCGAGTTCTLSPDEARREAIALLEAADYAEYGSGEWRDDGWHLTSPHVEQNPSSPDPGESV